MEAIVKFGAAAGDGIASTGTIFAKICARSGLELSTYNGYQSVIRGGHVWYQIRVSDERIGSLGDGVDLLMALDQVTADVHLPEFNPGALLLHDEVHVRTDHLYLPEGAVDLPVPLMEIAKREGREGRMQNTVSIGLVAGLLGIGLDVVEQVLEERFGGRDTRIGEANLNAATGGYSYALDKLSEHIRRVAPSERRRRLLLTGNEAIGLGAAMAGCKFYSAYPMTPASSILHFLAAHAQRYGILVKQVEDEIAAINMAIGAGFTGVRAMCGTSGGGFSLMTEAVGLAGMTEVPVVIVESQRGAPSTGLPTKTEQGDLNQMLGASQGDFPKVIVAPESVEDAYYSTIEAFTIAERYHMPVILASDLSLSERAETLDGLDVDVKIERGPLADPAEKGFKRYKITESGVSPRSIPGQRGLTYVAGSDEHMESGALISDVLSGLPESVKIRNAMMEKRMGKMEHLVKELEPPELRGPGDGDITLIGWGSTAGTIRDAVKILQRDGIKASQLQIKYLQPFHREEVKNILEDCRRCMVVELNYTGQLAKLICAETGVSVEDSCRKYSGEPFYPREIAERAKEVLKNA